MLKRLVFILVTFFAVITVWAQPSFKTIVTKGPVVTGESFQVQYVIEGLEKDDEFFAPDFKECYVSGPNIYSGSSPDSPKKLKNIVFTLVAVRPGKFMVPGASARIGDKLIKSESVWLEVISKADAIKKGRIEVRESNADYFLGPEEDPYAKMRRSLFMKVLVDKKTCFVGEPVTATFKLYSRLESKSDIVKNPGFYGFTVQDMISLEDKLTTSEIINGKKFDVHVVRKVQLYPLQEGVFNVDAMEVRNKVEFSKSAVSRKTEQEIVEGVFADKAVEEPVNTVMFENSMNTEPVAITVKPVPSKNKPAEYNGATGNFAINASIEKNELAKNEEGNLIITISGKGNFTQLSAPVIQWPVGIEGFEPKITDSLDHVHAPLSGKRVFHFRFVSAKPGSYILPAISFSFFKSDSNNYKTMATRPISISISHTEKSKQLATPEKRNNPTSHTSNWKWWTAGIFVFMGIVALVLLNRNKRKGKRELVIEKVKTVSLVEILQPAHTFSDADDKTFYNVLRNCIWNFFTLHFGLTGSKMNKGSLAEMMNSRNIDAESRQSILSILDQCETGVFTNAESLGDKKKLLETTKLVLTGIGNQV